jgi:selenocysteine lyase/cysteine desulfurase
MGFTRLSPVRFSVLAVASDAVATVAYDVEAVRGRFSALRRDLTFFDGPGGTQCPDEVIDAIAEYLRDSNANVSGPYETSRRTEALIANARLAGSEWLGCAPEEVVFGANMTTLNFALTRAAAREWGEGDEVLVTRLDHDANVSPWLELAHDLGLVVRFAEIRDDCTLDLDDLERQLGPATRVLAFPWASNAVGTVQDVTRLTAAVGADVVICSPYKFCGPHLGLAFARAELLERWRPYKVRPAPDEPLGQRYETGTLAHELLAGFVAAVDYFRSVGWDAIQGWERALGERFLAGLPERCRLYGLPTMEGRVATFAFTLAGRSPQQAATALGERGLAVWHGNYYALEVMRRLGLEDGGAVRAGIVHYNTAEEVDRLLEALASL